MKTNSLLSLALILTGLIVLSPDANAEDTCPLRSDISNDQARELKATILSEKSDDLDIIDAYDTLICSKRRALQEIAIESALKSNSKALKTTVVEELLFRKEIITVELEANESLAAKTLALIIEKPVCSIDIRKKNREARLITFGSSSTSISYDALMADVDLRCSNDYELKGRLSFQENSLAGKLRLTQNNGRINHGLVPAKIVLGN